MSRTRHHHRRQFSPAKSPGWWHHIFYERPMRALSRRLEKQCIKAADLDAMDRVLWPHASKPHHYYW